MRLGRTVAGTLAVLGSALLAGCGDGPSGESLCTTIGYSHLLKVSVTGDVDSVTDVRLCDESGCSPEPDPEGPSPGGLATQVTRSGDEWRFVLFATPDEVTIEVTHDDGEVTSVDETDLPWDRVSGTEECPGSHEAAVTVAV